MAGEDAAQGQATLQFRPTPDAETCRTIDALEAEVMKLYHISDTETTSNTGPIDPTRELLAHIEQSAASRARACMILDSRKVSPGVEQAQENARIARFISPIPTGPARDAIELRLLDMAKRVLEFREQERPVVTSPLERREDIEYMETQARLTRMDMINDYGGKFVEDERVVAELAWLQHEAASHHWEEFHRTLARIRALVTGRA
ncbi:hypothetical protein LTR09_004630 [Extremus antarcticus]|uniref:Uncharacterized protein n=1 Tax=Extremus antarcticus TaxID=702011 RepID=A0AAJ0DPI8_9PEZI|nr:hypothetical protein LTR09_004630 [Extremus antarcticus]